MCLHRHFGILATSVLSSILASFSTPSPPLPFSPPSPQAHHPRTVRSGNQSARLCAVFCGRWRIHSQLVRYCRCRAMASTPFFDARRAATSASRCFTSASRPEPAKAGNVGGAVIVERWPAPVNSALTGQTIRGWGALLPSLHGPFPLSGGDHAPAPHLLLSFSRPHEGRPQSWQMHRRPSVPVFNFSLSFFFFPLGADRFLNLIIPSSASSCLRVTLVALLRPHCLLFGFSVLRLQPFLFASFHFLGFSPLPALLPRFLLCLEPRPCDWP